MLQIHRFSNLFSLSNNLRNNFSEILVQFCTPDRRVIALTAVRASRKARLKLWNFELQLEHFRPPH